MIDSPNARLANVDEPREVLDAGFSVALPTIRTSIPGFLQPLVDDGRARIREVVDHHVLATLEIERIGDDVSPSLVENSSPTSSSDALIIRQGVPYRVGLAQHLANLERTVRPRSCHARPLRAPAARSTDVGGVEKGVFIGRWKSRRTPSGSASGLAGACAAGRWPTRSVCCARRGAKKSLRLICIEFLVTRVLNHT